MLKIETRLLTEEERERLLGKRSTARRAKISHIALFVLLLPMVGCATIGGFLYLAGISESRAYGIGLLISFPFFSYFLIRSYCKERNRIHAVNEVIRDRIPVELLFVDPMLRVFEVFSPKNRIQGYLVQATTNSFVYLHRDLVTQEWISDEEEDFLFPGSRLMLFRWPNADRPSILFFDGQGLKIDPQDVSAEWLGTTPQRGCEILDGTKADELLVKLREAAASRSARSA